MLIGIPVQHAANALKEKNLRAARSRGLRPGPPFSTPGPATAARRISTRTLQGRTPTADEDRAALWGGRPDGRGFEI